MAGNATVQKLSEQVKSRERVATHGEVFTNEREVNAMLSKTEEAPCIQAGGSRADGISGQKTEYLLQ